MGVFGEGFIVSVDAVLGVEVGVEANVLNIEEGFRGCGWAEGGGCVESGGLVGGFLGVELSGAVGELRC